MRKRTQKSPLEVVEMIDESDSSEDSRDEDYELGDDLFSKTSNKGVNKNTTKPRKFTLKRLKRRKDIESKVSERKFNPEQDFESDSPSPPNTSRLFQIVITRKHARLSSCLQRTYLSLSSDDKYVTISEILSFICECAGFKPNLINRHHLEDSSLDQDFDFSYSGSEFSKDNFGWDSFRNCYSDLPTTVIYKDVLKYKDKPELSDELFYGKNISFEHGDSISHKFYSMCNNRMKILTKKIDIKDGWMIDLVSVGFQRFCEFFSELVLQVEMQYFKDLLLLLQWVFTLSLSPYRSIRFLSCVVCNELISSLLLKLETLKKDQVVLKKQLSVEVELDRRASGRLGGTSVNLSGSTLELYKRLSLVNVTCSVISSFVKSSFHLNYSSKFFDVFPDIRIISAYYLVVHYLINSDIYGNEIYSDLVSNFLVDQDDNSVLLLKYLLIYKKELNPKTVSKLLQIYPSENKETNNLVEFVLLKYLNPDNKLSDPDTVETVKQKLFDEEFLHKNILYNNSIYFCCIFLVNHFPDYQFNLKFNLDLSNIRHKYTYAINHGNKVYNNYVYSYTRKKLDLGLDTNHSNTKYNEINDFNLDNMNTLCNTLMKYQKREQFSKFVNNLVLNLINLNFFNLNLSSLRYNNYIKFTTDMDKHALYNHILVLLVRLTSEMTNNTNNNNGGNKDTGSNKDNVNITNDTNRDNSSYYYDEDTVELNSNKDSRTENIEDFVEHSQDLYELNRNNNNNLLYLFTIFKELLNFNFNNKFKLVDFILNNFNNILGKSGKDFTSLTLVCINILSQILTSYNSNDNNVNNSISNTNNNIGASIYKSKINSLFNSNLLKLVKYVNKVNGTNETKSSNLNMFNSVSKSKSMSKTKSNLKSKYDVVVVTRFVDEDIDEIVSVLFTLNHFLISFNFIKLDNKQIFTLFNIPKEKENKEHNTESQSDSDVMLLDDNRKEEYNKDNKVHKDNNKETEDGENKMNNREYKKETQKNQEKEDTKDYKEYKNDKLVECFRRNGLYNELLVLYYLLYEYLIYNVVNDPKYSFDGLDRLRHKLLYLLVSSTGVEGLVNVKNSLNQANSFKSELLNSPNLLNNNLVHSPNHLNSTCSLNYVSSPNSFSPLKTTRSTKHVFVVLSSVFNVLKLSNVDFLNTSNYKFKLNTFIVYRILEGMTYVYLDLYSNKYKKGGKSVSKVSNTSKDNKDNNNSSNSKDNLLRRNRYSDKNKQVLSVLNDGSVSINYRYCLQSSGLYDYFGYHNKSREELLDNNINDKDKESKEQEKVEVDELDKEDENYEKYLSELNNLYMAESLTYQYTKTLNVDLFNSNLSLMVCINSCSGIERIRKASVKFLEILNRFNLSLYNLLMVHTMFTLYELSQKKILEKLVNQFNQFPNLEYVEMVYRVMQYVNKNQSNEKFLRYLKMMVFGNINTKNLDNIMEVDKEYNNKDRKEHNKEYKEVVSLIKHIKVNSNYHNTDDKYILNKISKLLKENMVSEDEKNKWFNNNLLVLRRSLSVKLVGKLCISVENSMSQYNKSTNKVSSKDNKDNNNSDSSKDTGTNKDNVNNTNDTNRDNNNTSNYEVEVKKRRRKRNELYPSDTTLVSNSQGFYNDMTTENPLMDSSSNNTTKDGAEKDNNRKEEYNKDNKMEVDNVLIDEKDDKEEQYTNVRITRSNSKLSKSNENNKSTNNNNKESKNKPGRKRIKKMSKEDTKENQKNQEEKEEYNTESDDDSPVVRRYSKRLLGTRMWLKSKSESFGLKGLSFGRGSSKSDKHNNNSSNSKDKLKVRDYDEESESLEDFEYLDEVSDSEVDFNMN